MTLLIWVPGIGKFLDTENRTEVASGMDKGRVQLLFSVYEFVWDNKTVLEIDRMVTQHCECL